ncbi:MAG TPA: glutathione S-transferase family protein [Steroidobacteraceae bacterium]|nr:glutathione S-transferase family protein [Steroidobacteraceae bacterium]
MTTSPTSPATVGEVARSAGEGSSTSPTIVGEVARSAGEGHAPLTVIGSYVSPFVRKVLVCLELKQLHYRIDPIVPFFGDDAFSQLSPLRRVPVLLDDRVTLSDSSVIVQYLEDRYPDRYPLYPADVADRARARWLEEYADTRMADVLIWRLFNKAVLEPGIWGQPRDLEGIARTMREDVPLVLDYLETQVPAAGFLFDAPGLGLADISLATQFRNFGFARQRIYAERWPRTAAYVDRVLAQPAFTALQRFEEIQVRTPIAQQREVLAGLGAPLTSHSYAAAAPRRGVMSP